MGDANDPIQKFLDQRARFELWLRFFMVTWPAVFNRQLEDNPKDVAQEAASYADEMLIVAEKEEKAQREESEAK